MPTLFTMNADVQDFMSPSFRGAAGTQIHFDLNITPGALLKVDDLERPTMALYHRAVGYIRSDGRMYDREPVSAAPYDLEDPGTLGVRLLADDPDLNLSGPVTYRVSGFRYLDGRKVGFGPYETTAVPSTDEVVDLADFLVPPADLVANTSDALIQDAVDEYVNANLFSTYAVQVNPADPNSLWQWQNIDGDPIGDPVPFPDIINVTAADIADAGVTGRALVRSDTTGDAWTALGTVPSGNLPSYVDDVVEESDFAALPATGESGKIYVTIDTGDSYRWSGSAYVRIADRIETAGITDLAAGRAPLLTGTQADARTAIGSAPADAGNPTAGEPVQPRRGTAAEWTAANPILAVGEEGLETDTNQSKRGDGVTAWAALPYVGKWDTIPGKPAVVAAGETQAEARGAIGAGTSNLTIGTTSTTAKAGNYHPAAADITNSTATGRAILTANDAAAARSQLSAVGKGELVLNVKDYGVKGDGQQLTTASISSGSAILTVTGANFTSVDVGKVITIYGAGTSGAPLNTSISAFTSSTQVTLSAAAATTVSNAEVVWGTDDRLNIKTALDLGRDTKFPPGIYVITPDQAAGGFNSGSVVRTIQGAGADRTIIFIRPTVRTVGGYALGGVISDLKIDAGYVPVDGVVENDTSSHGLYLQNVTGRNVRVTRTFASSFYVRSNCKVVGCAADKFGDHGVYGTEDYNSGNPSITDIVVSNCTITTDTSYFVNASMGAMRGAIKFRDKVNSVSIVGNTINCDTGILLTGKTDAEVPNMVSIVGNNITASYAGMMFETIDGPSPSTYRITECIVNGNTITNKSGFSSVVGVMLLNSSATIVGNTIKGTIDGISSNGVYDGPAWTVIGNTFRNVEYRGVRHPTNGSLIADNSFIACAIGVAANRYARIASNLFQGGTTSGVTIETASDATRVLDIHGNSFVGNSRAIQLQSGARSYAITGNTFSDNTATAAIPEGAAFNACLVKGNHILSGTGWPSTAFDSVKIVLDDLLANTATLNFGSVAAQSFLDLTITVTGAVGGDSVALGTPSEAATPGIAYTAWVSAADTVTVRAHNYTAGALDPASGVFKATIVR